MFGMYICANAEGAPDDPVPLGGRFSEVPPALGGLALPPVRLPELLADSECWGAGEAMLATLDGLKGSGTVGFLDKVAEKRAVLRPNCSRGGASAGVYSGVPPEGVLAREACEAVRAENPEFDAGDALNVKGVEWPVRWKAAPTLGTSSAAVDPEAAPVACDMGAYERDAEAVPTLLLTLGAAVLWL